MDIPATSSSKTLLLNKGIDVPKELSLSMEMEVAKELPLNRGKDESTTNYRLLDISATSPSRMEDDYTTSYYCRLKV